MANHLTERRKIQDCANRIKKYQAILASMVDVYKTSKDYAEDIQEELDAHWYDVMATLHSRSVLYNEAPLLDKDTPPGQGYLLPEISNVSERKEMKALYRILLAAHRDTSNVMERIRANNRKLKRAIEALSKAEQALKDKKALSLVRYHRNDTLLNYYLRNDNGRIRNSFVEKVYRSLTSPLMDQGRVSHKNWYVGLNRSKVRYVKSTVTKRAIEVAVRKLYTLVERMETRPSNEVLTKYFNNHLYRAVVLTIEAKENEALRKKASFDKAIAKEKAKRVETLLKKKRKSRKAYKTNVSAPYSPEKYDKLIGRILLKPYNSNATLRRTARLTLTNHLFDHISSGVYPGSERLQDVVSSGNGELLINKAMMETIEAHPGKDAFLTTFERILLCQVTEAS